MERLSIGVTIPQLVRSTPVFLQRNPARIRGRLSISEGNQENSRNRNFTSNLRPLDVMQPLSRMHLACFESNRNKDRTMPATQPTPRSNNSGAQSTQPVGVIRTVSFRSCLRSSLRSPVVGTIANLSCGKPKSAKRPTSARDRRQTCLGANFFGRSRKFIVNQPYPAVPWPVLRPVLRPVLPGESLIMIHKHYHINNLRQCH